MDDFQGFPKIPRLFRDIVITEKIDGTNAQVVIDNVEHIPQGKYEEDFGVPLLYSYDINDERIAIRAASRKRYITPNDDNYGFAKWVLDNGTSLAELGPGRHFGEWWGKGIQRGYGLDEKRFSLFNVSKWGNDDVRPECCHVVPVMYTGPFDMEEVRHQLSRLALFGSMAAPYFNKPEGIVVYHTAGNLLFKATLENDEKGKTE